MPRTTTRHATATRALLRTTAGALLCSLSAAQILIAPPRGGIGPGTGDANLGGPGDRRDSAIIDSASWTRWWTFNREPYLARLRAPFALPVSAAELGGGALASNPARPDPEMVHLEVVPMIREHLASTRDNDLLAAGLVALGKIGEPPAELAELHDLPRTADSILPHLKASNERVRDLAVLALGLLQEAEHAPLLADIALDRKEGRNRIKRRRLEDRTRAFAAYGLGHIGATTTRRSERAFVVHHLQVLLDESRDRVDLAVAATIALGWSPLPYEAAPVDDAPAQGRERTIALLFDVFEEAKLDARCRVQIPIAIARLVVAPVGKESTEEDGAGHDVRRQELRERAVRRFTEAIVRKTRERNSLVRSGCVQALGLLVADRAAAPDTTATDALLTLAEDGIDSEAGLALVALGRIAGRGTGAPDSKSSEVRRFLGETASNGKQSRRPWALLALGVAADRAAAGGAAPALGTRALIEARLRDSSSTDERAAAATALGLAVADDTAELVAGRLDNGDFWVRGLCALSLAMMDAEEWMPAMREIVSDNTYRPYLLRDVSTALALMGDRQLVDRLVFKLAQARFMPERVAALLGLAWSDDPNATPALIFVLREDRLGRKKIDDISRAFAATALGNICGQSALPWNTRYALDVTWGAAPPSLTDPRNGGGVLDVL